MIAEQQSTELVQIVERAGLAAEKAHPIITPLAPLVAEAGELVRSAESIVVTDATQLEEMKQARAKRLELRAVRVKVENIRKEIKADALSFGKAVDAAANWIKERIEPVESRLQAAEEFAERAQAKRQAELAASRADLLRPFGFDPSIYPLGTMTDDQWAQLLDGARTAHEKKIADAKKAEADRLAADAAAKAERERIEAENARLKVEADAREKAAAAERAKVEAERRAAEAKAKAEREAIEAQARKEREESEAKLKAEREAREKAEREAAAVKAEAERKQRKEDAARARAAAAPDADKLRKWAKSLVGAELPEMVTMAGQHAVNVFKSRVAALAKEIVAEADRITK